MRIIAGSAGGIPLKTPSSDTRPTADRVRESLFSSLGTLLYDAKVLDLYAGSGALGIEALSRGAASACFVEQQRQACEVIQANLDKARLAGGLVRCAEVMKFLSGHSLGAGVESDLGYDLIFADPPYAKDQQTAALLLDLINDEHLVAALKDGGVLILESMASVDLPEDLALRWQVRDERCYGETRVSFLRKKEWRASA
ncbi:MAG: 16S rRNA (guanine(966)-N(2))-methyltransferase RsmD [Verrucomicrobiales bacterium]|nr:16S rRNA (guanine(966)-N(2))-methyltransferase RsmD [Verrucomicrobiales bacterium]